MKPERYKNLKHFMFSSIVGAAMLMSRDEVQAKHDAAPSSSHIQTLSFESLHTPNVAFLNTDAIEPEIEIHQEFSLSNTESVVQEPEPQVEVEAVVTTPHVMQKDIAITVQIAPQGSAPASCPELISSALGWSGCAISYCESGWDESETGSAGERGWFQIHPKYHTDSTHDPVGNVIAGVRISKGGTDWSQWTTRSVLQTGICPNGKGVVPS